MEDAMYKTQSILGAINDTIEVGIAKIKGDQSAELGVALIKATRQDEAVPKEKHVLVLVDACRGEPPAATLDFIVLGLFKRLEEYSKAWLVTLKTLIVFHRLIREADSSFQVEVLRLGDGTGHARLFRLEAFSDATTKDTPDFSAWIRVYSAYLDERLATFRATKFDPARSNITADEEISKLSSFSVADLLDYVTSLQRLLSALTNCIPVGAARTNEVTLLACSLVLRELIPVYSATNEGARALVDRIFITGKADAEKGAELVGAYKALTAKMAGFADSISGIPTLKAAIKLPTLKPLPEEVQSKVDEYVKNAPQEAPKLPAASAPSMADLLGFQSFIFTPSPAPDAAAAAAPAGGSSAAAAGADAAVAAPAKPFDPFASYTAPAPPPDPLDMVFGGALDALTQAVKQEVSTEKAEEKGGESTETAAVAPLTPPPLAPQAPQAGSPDAPTVTATAIAGAGAASRSGSEAVMSPALSPKESTASASEVLLPPPLDPPTVVATAAPATGGTAQPYTLKPKDPLDFLSTELFGDRTPPPTKPMKESSPEPSKVEDAPAVHTAEQTAEKV